MNQEKKSKSDEKCERRDKVHAESTFHTTEQSALRSSVATILIPTAIFFFCRGYAAAALVGGESQVIQALADDTRLQFGPSYIAYGNDVLSVSANPGSLGFIQQKGLALGESVLFENTVFNKIAWVQPTLSWGSYGIAANRLQSAKADRYDAQGNAAGGSFNDSQTLLQMSYGRMLPDIGPLHNLSLGVQASYLLSQLETAHSSFMLLDMGGRYHFANQAEVGVRIKDLLAVKQGETADKLPMTPILGGSFPLANGAVHAIGELEAGPQPFFRVGLNYDIVPAAGFRLGLNGSNPGFGIRLAIRNYSLDYGVTVQALGVANQISLSARFGQPISKIKTEKLDKYYHQAEESAPHGYYEIALEALQHARSQEPTPIEYENLYRGLNTLVQAGVTNLSKESDSNQMLRRGVNSFLAGQPEVAKETFQTAYNKDSQDPMAQRLLALATGVPIKPKSQGAIVAQTPSGAYDVDPIRVKLFEADKLFHRGKYDQVLQNCKEVLDINPLEVMAYVKMGSAYYALGMKGEAKRAWLRAGEINPTAPEVRRAMEFIQQEGL